MASNDTADRPAQEVGGNRAASARQESVALTPSIARVLARCPYHCPRVPSAQAPMAVARWLALPGSGSYTAARVGRRERCPTRSAPVAVAALSRQPHSRKVDQPGSATRVRNRGPIVPFVASPRDPCADLVGQGAALSSPPRPRGPWFLLGAEPGTPATFRFRTSPGLVPGP